MLTFEITIGDRTLPISKFTLGLLGLEEEGQLEREDYTPLLRDLRRHGAGLVADTIERANPRSIKWGRVVV